MLFRDLRAAGTCLGSAVRRVMHPTHGHGSPRRVQSPNPTSGSRENTNPRPLRRVGHRPARVPCPSVTQFLPCSPCTSHAPLSFRAPRPAVALVLPAPRTGRPSPPRPRRGRSAPVRPGRSPPAHLGVELGQRHGGRGAAARGRPRTQTRCGGAAGQVAAAPPRTPPRIRGPARPGTALPAERRAAPPRAPRRRRSPAARRAWVKRSRTRGAVCAGSAHARDRGQGRGAVASPVTHRYSPYGPSDTPPGISNNGHSGCQG